MRRVTFHKASTLDEALDRKARAGGEGRFLAGGTDLIIGLREQSSRLEPLTIIDLTGIEELRRVELVPGDPQTPGAKGAEGGPGPRRVLRLGPMLTHAEAERHPLLRRHAFLLSQACAQVGSPQIRNLGTLGGNLVHASPCADTVPPLLALEARVTLASGRGRRTVPVSEFLLAPYKTALAEDELLTSILLISPPDGAVSAFCKLGRRRALSVSRMSLAASGRIGEDGGIDFVRVAAGSVAPTPRRFPEVESFLAGRVPSPELLDQAGARLAGEMIEITGRRWSTPYKERVVKVLLRRVLDGLV